MNENSDVSTSEQKSERRFANVDRDEATLGVSKNRETDSGLASEDQPTWHPPESQPEPRPAQPIMNPSQPSNPSTNTNSPA